MEVLWSPVEGRLIAKLEGVEALTLKRLNDATVAWVKRDYHRLVHRELGTTPLAYLLNSDRTMAESSAHGHGSTASRGRRRVTRRAAAKRRSGAAA